MNLLERIGWGSQSNLGASVLKCESLGCNTLMTGVWSARGKYAYCPINFSVRTLSVASLKGHRGRKSAFAGGNEFGDIKGVGEQSLGKRKTVYAGDRFSSHISVQHVLHSGERPSEYPSYSCVCVVSYFAIRSSGSEQGFSFALLSQNLHNK